MRATQLQPPRRSPRRPVDVGRTPLHPPTPQTPHFPPGPSPSLFLRHGRRCRARATVKPRPPSSPCCTTVSILSAIVDSVEQLSPERSHALQRLLRPHLHRASPKIPFDVAAASTRPRPRRLPLRDRRELLHLPILPVLLLVHHNEHTKLTRTRRRGAHRRRVSGQTPATPPSLTTSLHP